MLAENIVEIFRIFERLNVRVALSISNTILL